MSTLMKPASLVTALIALFYCGLVSADVINGRFYLTVNQPNSQGGVIYEGTYETADTSDSANIATVNGVDYVQLTDFQLTGLFQTGVSLPAPFGGSTTLTFGIDDFTTSAYTGQAGSAALSGTTSVAFLSGNATVSNGPLSYFLLSLGGDLTTSNNGDWSLGGGFPILSYNGDQTIPEPNILALLGAGLIGIGFMRKRKRQK